MNNQTIDPMEILNGVDAFYRSAWDKLVIIGTVSFAVIGVLVPFMIQWYQKKTIKISEELLKKEIEHLTIISKNEVLLELNTFLEEKVKLMESKMDRLNASAEAKVFHVQGTNQLRAGHFGQALVDYVTAGRCYLDCEDYFNLGRVIGAIHDDCFDKVSSSELDDLKTTSNFELVSFLDEVEQKDDRHVFTDTVRALRLKINKKSNLVK